MDGTSPVRLSHMQPDSGANGKLTFTPYPDPSGLQRDVVDEVGNNFSARRVDRPFQEELKLINPAARLSQAQDNPTAAEWCDDGQTGFCWYRYDADELQTGWGFMFPRDSAPGRSMNEFIGILSAPVAVGWLGASLGGGMRSNPLIVGWLNGTAGAISIRRTE